MATIVGTNGNDTIRTGRQDDTIDGRGGNDQLRGNLGDDLIHGRLGNDALFGEGNADRLHGGAGNDMMFGGDGADRMWGDAGKDDMHGDEGDDIILGRDGDDRLWGDLGNDVVIGGIGNDDLIAFEGEDVMTGNAGADDFLFSFTQRPFVLDGDEQFDEVSTVITDFFQGTDDARFSYVQRGENGQGEDVVQYQDVFTLPDLDSNRDGVLGAGDDVATVRGNNLVIDVAQLPGIPEAFPLFGTITFQGITELRGEDIIR